MSDIETIDRVVDSEDARTRRLSMTSGGKYASGIYWIAVDDVVTMQRHVRTGDGDCAEPPPTVEELLSLKRCDGDQVDFEMKNKQSKILDLSLHKTKLEADRGARGLNQKYGNGINKNNWNKIRKWGYPGIGVMGMEIGSHAPLRVKVIAVPEDELAESCENYAEYAMKCDLRGIKPPLGETEFKIYKY